MFWIYDVVMQTPLGPRYGRMSLQAEGGIADGRLSLLKSSESVYGEIDTCGRCKLRGKLSTLFRTIDFCAVGYANEERLSLTLCTKRGQTYQMHGVAKQAKGDRE